MRSLPINLPAHRAEPACDFARAAFRALLVEVNLTPKPGLVDRHNTGAHRDMDPALLSQRPRHRRVAAALYPTRARRRHFAGRTAAGAAAAARPGLRKPDVSRYRRH